MAYLYCAVCRKCEDSLQSLKSLSRTWITGSMNRKADNMLDHASSEVHKVSMARKKTDITKASSRSAVLSSTIGCCLSTLDSSAQAWMERKFDLCFVMARQSILFTICPGLLELKQRHEVDLGHTYNTVDSARQFTSFIAQS